MNGCQKVLYRLIKFAGLIDIDEMTGLGEKDYLCSGYPVRPALVVITCIDIVVRTGYQ